MISKVSSNNKGKQAKMKNSVKKRNQTGKTVKTASPRDEPGLSASASNSLTTAPP